ncbi:MAG TPA: CHAT domain-containing protein [Thermoanaerobaculia bacterium]|nr:CHAT domain-containing protein [Thermoanaerobaculia bacterium]
MLKTASVLVGLGIAAAGVKSYWLPLSDPVSRLAKNASVDARSIEPRITGGFRWAPLRAVKRGGAEALEGPSLVLTAAALQTIRDAPEDGHATGIAQLLIGNATAAQSALEAIGGNDAKVWCDLAAARYTVAVAEDDPVQLTRALAAADAALKRDPGLAEARFNRALILERLGLRDLAREQWETYLAADSGSGWANEARDHVRQLQPIPPFEEELDRAYERLASDPAAAHAFAREYRQDSRRWGETIVLGNWARAEHSGDRPLAAKHLRVARELGAELARDRGDQMLRALVAAIDGATPEQYRALLDAHLAFSEGQKVNKDGEPGRATPLLLAAAERFEHGHSPGVALARYVAATTQFTQGEIEAAQAALARLLAENPQGFMAQRAQVLWQLGLVQLAQGRWGPCIITLTESTTIFDRLGEESMAASVREILAEAYDRVGNSSAAWENRLVALRVLGRTMTYRLQIVIASMSREAVMNRDWPTAGSLLDLEIDVAKHVKDPELHVEALIRRARVLVETDKAAAAGDLRDARMRLAQIADPGFRVHLEANALAVEALVATTPQASMDLLTRAIRFHSDSGRRMYLPELLFDRGRASLMLNDQVRAAADFEAAIAELEAHRESLPSGEDRVGMFHDADELFDAAVATSMSRNLPDLAFGYVERARARSLLESLGTAWRTVDPAAIAPRSIIVEYSVHEHEVAIFTVTSRGIRVIRRPIEQQVLAAAVEEHARAARESDVPLLRKTGRSLYEALVAPIEEELERSDTVVFVPDPVMARLPFAALVDGQGKYLIESHPLVVDPSAAVYLQLARSRRRNPDERVLIVSGADKALGRLSAARREAADVAAAYSYATPLSGLAATRDAFAREAAKADAIHFVGHAVASPGSGKAGYLVLSGAASNEGELDLKQIASLKLRETSFVVLAACATAGGEQPSSEGTISIARAFVAAGVPSVIATLWPIEDEESADFFPLIHRHRAQGLPPAEALRAAQLEWIHRRGASTALWSAVQLIGN